MESVKVQETKMKHDKLQEQAGDKSHVHLHETVIELTLLAFLKSAVKKNEIDKEK